MKRPFKAYLNFVFFFLTLAVISCKDKEDSTPADTSKVTGLTLTLDTIKKGHQDANASLEDAAGIKGKTGSTITLDNNGFYAGTLVLTDATETPAATVTSDYNITYLITGADATISASGSTPTITTKAAGSGILTITMTKDSKNTVVSFPLTIR